MTLSKCVLAYMYMSVYVCYIIVTVTVNIPYAIYMYIQVFVGEYLSESLEQPLVYISPAALPLEIIIPVVAGSVVVVVILSLFIICCLVLRQCKQLRKTDREWLDMISPKDSRNQFGRLSVVSIKGQRCCTFYMQ